VTYRFNLPANIWMESTAGFSFTDGVFDSDAHRRGLQDTQVWRVQAGERLGTSYQWDTVRVEPSLYVGVYSDVSVRGGTTINNVQVGGNTTDEGQLWLKAVLKYNFIWTSNFSSYIQAEIHGTDAAIGNTFHAANGTINDTGYVATAGLRWTWGGSPVVARY
jgi:hypothetical protein